MNKAAGMAAASLRQFGKAVMPYMYFWHGAKADSWFSHIAVEVPGVNCSNEWLEPVSDEQYGRLGK